jgi:hypothetical protein
MLLNLALLDHPVVAKPATTIETLGDAIEFLARLAPEVRAQSHWRRAIHSVGAAIKEPRYVIVATLNLQMALATDHLLLGDPPASPRPPEPPGKT